MPDELVRIAAPVETFVVARDRLGDGFAACHHAQDVRADGRVRLDELVLFFGEPAGLAEQRTRYRDLAEVEQRRRLEQRVAIGIVEDCGARESGSQAIAI